jgi:very-short-patch-repair endonuclease
MIKHNYIEKSCHNCKQKYQTKKKTSKFCSELCYQEYRKSTNVSVTCNNCGKDFSVRKSRYKLGLVKYCSLKCRNTSEEWIESNRIKNLNQLHKTGLNKLELSGRKLLNKIGINFLEQELVGDIFVVDVLIPHKKLVIQWDGDYWHGHPKNQKNGKPNKLQTENIKKDKRVNKKLIEMGYDVLRFWQDDVDNNPEYVIETISKKLK